MRIDTDAPHLVIMETERRRHRLAPAGSLCKVLLAYDALGYHYHPMDEAKYLRIADRDGSALAQWYNRDPALLSDLLTLGMTSLKLGTCAPRHVLADVAINRWTWSAWLSLARALAGPMPNQSMLVYRKLFQWRKRRAIDAGIETVNGRTAALPA